MNNIEWIFSCLLNGAGFLKLTKLYRHFLSGSCNPWADLPCPQTCLSFSTLRAEKLEDLGCNGSLLGE